MNEKKQQYEERIHDLSTKLKTISDRHRKSTTAINNDNKMKNQHIEQLMQQVEQIGNERRDLHRQVCLRNHKILFSIRFSHQCCVKDATISDLQVQIQTLERRVHPVEVTVPKADYDKLNNELQTSQKHSESLMNRVRSEFSLGNLEFLLKRFKQAKN